MPKVSKLTDAHREQICSMCEDGKTYKEVKEFFKKTYNIKLWDAEISKLCKRQGIKVTRKRGPNKKRKNDASSSKEQKALELCGSTEICKFIDICNPEVCKHRR